MHREERVARMRVIAGTARGRLLRSARGAALRPTTDRVRESWFSMVGHRVAGAAFLDLYAGTGAIGIEALSRGAARCTLVEKNRRCAECIRENLKVLGELDPGTARVWQMDALAAIAALHAAGEVFDLVFADPPYGEQEAPGKTLTVLGAAGSLLARGALVTIQHSRRVPLPESTGLLRRVDERDYGDTRLSLYERTQ
ncbi:MAG: 16S rRNA (guanine(966)-N(2))-methyltransferase RsmD [Armatimonadota bacterium]|nr:16S rRNA (guanine(966)-N(2))-methyltransferase RsmD [Armatimonadota bacterium]